jgi:hypothetical protein
LLVIDSNGEVVMDALVGVDIGALSALGTIWRVETSSAKSDRNTALRVPPNETTVTVVLEATAPSWSVRGAVKVAIIALPGTEITLCLTEALEPFLKVLNLSF